MAKGIAAGPAKIPWACEVLFYYILDEDGEAVPVIDVIEWARWLDGNPDRMQVDDTWLGKVRVSTVFFGLNRQWGEGPPLLFETMVFGGLYDLRQWRWTTRIQAQAGHDRIVAAIRDGQEP